MQQQPNKVALILCGGDINFSDLPIITNRSNAMIPVNGKPVIGWILDDLVQKDVMEVILVLRFDNYKLFNYVEWAFAKNMTVHYAFVQEGGTILHSLLAGLAWVKPGSGVHIILGDTLLRDKYPDKPDFVFAGEYENSEDWCLVKTNEAGEAIEYLDKIKTPSHNGLQAVAGVYSLSDTALLRNIIMHKIRNGSKEISQVLKDYGHTKKIRVVKATEWYDFGHIHYFNLAKRKLLQSRYFNTLTIDPLKGMITKQSQKSDKLSDELHWYKSLPPQLQLLCPRLIESNDNDTVTICQEYYGYPNLAELYVFGDIGLSVWMNALRKLMDIHVLLRDEKGKIEPSDIWEMYWEKTHARLGELSKEAYWKDLLKKRTLEINGTVYVNFCALEEKVKEVINRMSLSTEGGIIHGDYCFSNILYDLNSQLVRLVDPRGSFGKQKIFGDPRYDIAKLRHSVSGLYDFIIADLFKVAEQNEVFSLEFFKPEAYDSLCKFFDELTVQFGYKPEEVKLIEGLLFVSMVPYHKDKFERQLAMYLNGVIILNQVLEHENSN